MEISFFDKTHRYDGTDGSTKLKQLILAYPTVKIVQRPPIFKVEPLEHIQDNYQVNTDTY